MTKNNKNDILGDRDTNHQKETETLTREYTPEYVSGTFRDVFVADEHKTVRHVYGLAGNRISSEFDYAEDTEKGGMLENIATDRAVDIGKVYYRTNLLDSTLIAVDEDGDVIRHVVYDEWGMPESDTYVDENFYGIDNINNYTGYMYDEVLGLYFAQNRFYDPQIKRFTQEDPIKDGENWYVYVRANPLVNVDPMGLFIDVGIPDGVPTNVHKKLLAEGLIPLQLTAEAYGGEAEYIKKSAEVQVDLFGIMRWYTVKGGDDAVREEYNASYMNVCDFYADFSPEKGNTYGYSPAQISLFMSAKSYYEVTKCNTGNKTSATKLSDKGFKLLKELEISGSGVEVYKNGEVIGIKNHIVNDGGVTLGVGIHVKYGAAGEQRRKELQQMGISTEAGAVLTNAEVEKVFRKYENDYGNYVKNFATRNGVILSQQQFDALFIMAYNRPALINSSSQLNSLIKSNNTNYNDWFNAIINQYNKLGGWSQHGNGWSNRTKATLNVYFDGVYKKHY